MNYELNISKLDAAKRQLESAIRIYFHNGDPVSIHTLTAAAYNVIRDINKKRGGESMLIKEQILDQLKPEHIKTFRDKINQAENFFKHADRDHDGTLKFNPLLTEFLIIDACSQYYKLTGEDAPLFAAFRGWHIINYPDLFKFDDERNSLFKQFSNITYEGRTRYFQHAIPILMSTYV